MKSEIFEIDDLSPGLYFLDANNPLLIDAFIEQICNPEGLTLSAKSPKMTDKDIPKAFYWGPEASTYFLLDNIRDELALRLSTYPLANRDSIIKEKLVEYGLNDLGDVLNWISPHSISGGQQQRLLAAAISLSLPTVLVAQTPLSYVSLIDRPNIFISLEKVAKQESKVILLLGEDPLILHKLSIPTLQITPLGLKKEEAVISLARYTSTLRMDHMKNVHQRHPLLIVEDIEFRYPNGRVGIFLSNLQVKPGVVSAVVGPNGGGKSSLFRCLISNFNLSGNSSMFFDGIKVKNPYKDLVRTGKVAFSLQDPNAHMSTTSLKMLISSGAISSMIAEALSLDVSSDDEIISVPFWTKQAIAMALVLSSNAKVLLLDEPFDGYASNIVGTSATKMIALTRDSGRAVLIITHNPRLAISIADEYIWVENQEASPPYNASDAKKFPKSLNTWLATVGNINMV